MSNPTALRISLLGGFAIRIDGELITDIATRKAEALLAYLACNPQPHRRELLSELFWDDLTPERALGNLRLALNQLRPRCAAFLDISRATVAIRPNSAYWLDIDALAQGLAGEPEAAAAALALYHGDFLQGFHVRDARGFSEWQHTQAEYWRRMASDGMRRLVTYYSARSTYAEGLTWARRLLNLDPLDEATHRQLMLLLARSGQRHAALRQYHLAAAALRAEFGIEPEPATTALYERLAAGPEQRPHNLPPARAQVGRATEMAQIVEWMAVTPTRLLTISGPGGSGKTHLALNAAHKAVYELIGPYRDGVRYLALVGHGPQRRVNADTLMATLAQTLDVKLTPREAPAVQLGRYLGERELLLLIDNGELLTAEARSELSALLAAAPALHLIIPSRERLKLREESLLELDGLPYPAAAALSAATPPDPADYAALRLLLQRTGSAAVTAADQRDLGAICRLVHGLPLALELAAPWLTVRSPQELAAAIAANIDVLQSDAPDLPERQRSIRAVFDYSWRLLTEPEAAALAGLSVFPADFSAGAAEQIVGAGLAALGALRDKSLLQVLPGAAETRYALHPLLQRFALDKLQADGATFAALSSRHAAYFAAFAETHKPLLYGAASATAIASLEREFANIRSGWAWAVQQHDIAMLGAYSIPLHDFMALRSWNVESLHLFGAGAAAVRAWAAHTTPDEALSTAAVRVLSCYAELEQIMGDPAQAERAYHDCRVLLNAIAAEDTPELLFVYKQIGLLAYGRGAYAEALQYLRLTLAIAEEGADAVRVADTLLSIGAVLIAQGVWPAAEQTLRRALALYDDLHYAWGRGHALRFLGTLALLADDRTTAAEQLQAALEASRAIDNRIGAALSLDQLGLLYLAEQQYDASAAALHEALELFQASGVDLGSGRTLAHLAGLAVAQGRHEPARRHLGHALLIAERLPSPPLLLECAAAILALHRREHMGLPPELTALAATLSRHPAGAADTQRQLAALAGDVRPADSVPTPEELASTLHALLSAGSMTRTV